jgi:hypothetical protein
MSMTISANPRFKADAAAECDSAWLMRTDPASGQSRNRTSDSIRGRHEAMHFRLGDRMHTRFISDLVRVPLQ